MSVKVGDLVKVVTYPRQARLAYANYGIVLRNTYCTYDPEYNRWEVYMRGDVVELHERVLINVPIS